MCGLPHRQVPSARASDAAVSLPEVPQADTMSIPYNPNDDIEPGDNLELLARYLQMLDAEEPHRIAQANYLNSHEGEPNGPAVAKEDRDPRS
jgi:hypothetical protein